MREVIVPAPAVKITVAYLSAATWPWDVEVRGRRPRPTSGRLVTVRRVGGIRPSLVVDGPFLSFDCFADAPDQAEELANHAYALMLAMAGRSPAGVPCYVVDTLSGPSERYDAAGEIDRYAFSVVAHLRASAV